jgi:spermidine synthase
MRRALCRSNSMAWQCVESAQHGDTHLELYAKDGIFMIRANGLELMNGFSHDSETAFGRLVAELAPNAAPNILIAGLGLGYTLAAASEGLGMRGTITVAEFSAAVIDWFERYVHASVLPRIPENIIIRETDAIAHLKTGAQGSNGYDLILLDIDNGPEPLVRASNAVLYDREGLELLRHALTAEGRVLLWSGFQSAGFEAKAREAGFSVARRVVANGPRPELDHHIYVLSAKPLI